MTEHGALRPPGLPVVIRDHRAGRHSIRPRQGGGMRAARSSCGSAGGRKAEPETNYACKTERRRVVRLLTSRSLCLETP